METYTRKVKKTGSSIQATIPADIAKVLDLQPGDSVVYKRKENGEITLEKEQTFSDQLGISPEFLQVLHEGMDEYQDALKSLVER